MLTWPSNLFILLTGVSTCSVCNKLQAKLLHSTFTSEVITCLLSALLGYTVLEHAAILLDVTVW